MRWNGTKAVLIMAASMAAAVAAPATAIDDLTLNVDPGSVCVSSGQTVTVTLDVANLSAAINGVQARLSYDNTLLTLVDIVPTDLGIPLPAAGWVEVSQSDVGGNVTWAAVINGSSIALSHTIATLTFTAIADGTASITFLPDSPPFLTKLTRAIDNATILPAVLDSGGIFIGPPVCAITADAAVCDGTSGHVVSVPNAGVGASYAWTVTGGTIDSGQNTTSISYTAGAGPTVTIDITITDANGCPSSCQQIVTVNPNPDCTITAAASVCANSIGNPATVPDAGVGASYVWTVTGGVITAGQGTTALAFTAGVGPNVTIDITVTDANGCVSSCQTIIAVAAPDCTITAANAVCDGSLGNVASVPDAGVGATYTWTVTGGTITSGQFASSMTYTATSPLSVTIDVTVTGGAGCNSSCQKIVSVNANPDGTITAEAAVCDGTAGHVVSVPDAGVGATYAWTVTGGTLDSGAGTSSISYTAGAGPTVTIDVTVTDANLCFTTSQFIATVNANPDATVTAAAAVCDGSTGNVASVLMSVGASYAWTVTGGTLDSGQNTDSIAYTAGAGPTLTIDVTITDANGCISSGQAIVTVNPNPDCTISAASQVCDGATGNIASVLDAGVGATYAWTVTGGTLDAGQGTSSISYTAGAGPTITIDITVTNSNGCVSTCQSIVTVSANPVCTISASAQVCDGSTGNIASTTDVGVGATYAWVVTGGTISSGQNTPSITYTAGAGPSVVLDLTVTESSGCISVCQQIVTVNANPACVITAEAAVCDGTAGHVASVPDAGVGASYAWVVTGGTIDSAMPFGSSISYTAGAGPTLTVDVTVTDANGCSTSCQQVVTVNPNPSATITAVASVCDGSVGNPVSVPDAGVGSTYAWVITGGTIEDVMPFGAAITYTAGVGPTLTIDVTVTNANGCVSVGQQIVTVNTNPTCSITAEAAVCDGTSSHFASVPSAGVGANYTWTITGGTLDSGQNTNAITYTAGVGPTLTIDVTIVDANGCTSSCQNIVTVNANPACTITAAAAVCADSAGNNVFVSDAGVGASYAWTITGGTLTGGQNTTAITYVAGAGPTVTIDVTVTDANGCVSSCQQLVTVNVNPDCTISANNLVCEGSTGNIASVPDAGVGASYIWTVTGGTLNSGQGSTSITYTAGTGTTLTLGITVTSVDGCVSVCSQVITVNAPDCSILGANDVCFQSVGNFAAVADAGVGSTYFWLITGGTLTSGQGTSSITYTAGSGLTVTLDVTVVNSNGCSSNCQKIVNIIQPSIDVTLQLEGVTSIVTRDVTFLITQCPGTIDTRVIPVTTDAFGVGTVTIPNTNPLASWINVQEGHTLSRLSSVLYATCSVATVTMTGANSLLAGDLHTGVVAQDDLVDITDFSILASGWNQPISANLTTGGDVDGDGLQSTSDFTAIQVNFFSLGAADDSCALQQNLDGERAVDGDLTSITGVRRAGRVSIPVSKLEFAGADRADLTGDGIVDVRDIRAFARLHGLELLPEFTRKIGKLEMRKGRASRR